MTDCISLQNFDYVAIFVYIALMAVIGFAFGWFVKDSGSFLKGGGAIPRVMATITNYMGLFSTFVFVAYAGIAYEYGFVAITVFLTTVPGCLVAGLVFGARWRRTGDTTPVEYLERRYGYPVRKLVMWLGLIMRFLDNMVRLYAIGLFISAVAPLSLEWSIVVSGVIVTLLNIVGGIWTVSIMSTVQFIILILVTAILLPLSIDASGGFAALTQKFPEHLDFFNGPKGQWLWLAVYCVMVTIKYNENWTFIQKFYCVRDESAAKKVGIYSAVLFLVFAPVFLIPAVLSPLIVPDIHDPEMSYVMISSMLLPAGVMGIMFSSMFAATMSSLNAEYNIMAGVITTDIYKRMFNPLRRRRKTSESGANLDRSRGRGYDFGRVRNTQLWRRIRGEQTLHGHSRNSRRHTACARYSCKNAHAKFFGLHDCLRCGSGYRTQYASADFVGGRHAC